MTSTASTPHTGLRRALGSRSWRAGLRTGLIAGGALTGLGATAAAGIAGYYARMAVTPPTPTSSEVLPILGVGFDAPDPEEGRTPTSVTLPANAETLVPGRYQISFDGGRSQARLGEILSYSPKLGTVVRAVEHVESGDLGAAKKVRWSGAIWRDPADAGYPFEEVTLDLPVGEAPAWLVPAPAGSSGQTWAIMVHGRGASRQETLRALATTQRLGLTSLHVTYRNDSDAPASADGRYGLGFTEWQDVQVAVEYALAHGARDLVLFGWSMGGAIALQTADKSPDAERIRALVLDGPVVDWFELIRFHTRQYRLPLRLGQLVADLLSAQRATLMTGLDHPIRLTDLDWITRSAELRVPTLILHSVDDEYVPASASMELAERSPRVTLVPFQKARHTKEWNVDPARWEAAVLEWLPAQLG